MQDKNKILFFPGGFAIIKPEWHVTCKCKHKK